MSEDQLSRNLGFRRQVAFARAAAAVERIWPAVWPCAAVLATFLILSLTGLWPRLPAWLHLVGLITFAGLIGWTGWRSRPALAMPDRDAGLSRLERVNALAHQPLRSLGDRLAAGGRDPGSLTLWRRHRERMLRSLDGLRVGAPRSDLPRLDPWALRAALLLLLVAAVVEAGGAAPERLRSAFDLSRASAAAVTPLELTVWVTPPVYTGYPPLRLDPAAPAAEGGPPAAVSVPEGSEVLAQVHHAPESGDGFALSLGEQDVAFAATGERSIEAKLVIDRSGELRAGPPGQPLAAWTIEAVPDLAPEVAFAGQPEATHRGVLRTAFRASDDYAVTSVALLLSRPGAEDQAERLELIRPGRGANLIEDGSYLDLTPHRWAGLPVTIRLEAVDGLDQRGQSELKEIVLPARQFNHPLARAVIEQRRQLADRPEERATAAAGLNRLSQDPQVLREDPAVFLALRSAAQRLLAAPEDKTIEEVLDLLWDTALHLEDGQLSLAERELRELQEALQDALAEGASDEELERLMNQLEQAMREYLEALARQAQEMARDQQQMPLDQQAMQVRPQDLQQMLDQVREMIQTGAREAAQQMLAQLQEMLENLQVAQQGQMSQGQQMLNQLQEMIQRQQGLLDQTFDLSRQQDQMGQQGQMGQQSQQMQPGQQGQMGQRGQGQRGQFGQGQPGGAEFGSQSGQLAFGQEALRRALGELMGTLGDAGVPIPRSLGEAELSMRGARDALQEGAPGQALDPQAQALDQLRQGGQAMLDEMQRMMGQAPGQGQATGQPFGQNPDGRDPLGRSMFNQGGADLYGERVPSELELGKARAIMEELYRRAGERNRPPEELDYLKRLLRRF